MPAIDVLRLNHSMAFLPDSRPISWRPRYQNPFHLYSRLRRSAVTVRISAGSKQRRPGPEPAKEEKGSVKAARLMAPVIPR